MDVIMKLYFIKVKTFQINTRARKTFNIQKENYFSDTNPDHRSKIIRDENLRNRYISSIVNYKTNYKPLGTLLREKSYSDIDNYNRGSKKDIKFEG